jgi:hypothetical protein
MITFVDILGVCKTWRAYCGTGSRYCGGYHRICLWRSAFVGNILQNYFFTLNPDRSGQAARPPLTVMRAGFNMYMFIYICAVRWIYVNVKWILSSRCWNKASMICINRTHVCIYIYNVTNNLFIDVCVTKARQWLNI